MPNPYLPTWEYIPDGEPHVFGERIYVYGSHDNAGSDKFCDYKLKVWSAPVNDPTHWTCHGHIFHTKADRDHVSDTDWTNDNDLYAPDVVEKDGKYYLFAYIMGARGCVAVSEKPEGPFQLISKYEFHPEDREYPDRYEQGWFIDPGVLVDDDGQVYIYCGFERSFAVKINPDNMYEIIDDSYTPDIIPDTEPFRFYEACSPRKIGDIYYLIYSPKVGSRLDYATAKAPLGPFTYRGTIVDNGVDYQGGNNHGSICQINGQWYIFYHRMTNGTVMSRRGCVEKIEILPDGTIPQVEMTSLGFDDSLSPYEQTKAELACVLKGGCFVNERNIFTRMVSGITSACVIGYKYFDFGEDFSSKTMKFAVKVTGTGCKSVICLRLDDPENGEEIGTCEIGMDSGVYSSIVKKVTGRHALYMVVEDSFGGWFKESFEGRHLFELEEFVFLK